MGLKLYLDDCAFSYRLRQLLLTAGHIVQIPAEVEPPLTGQADAIHFAHVRATGQIILTYNPADFVQLHEQYPAHAGIFAAYQDNNPARDMTYADVVRAIANLQQMGVPLAGNFWILNAYQW
ncbi:MAG: hypothetical protein KF832_29630 [Caldilineaceae bacterium]|nr:hypothetical protein [Caldilineaceae bacterium]